MKTAEEILKYHLLEGAKKVNPNCNINEVAKEIEELFLGENKDVWDCVIAAMNELKKSQWISVKERLPEPGERVLVDSPTYGTQIGWLKLTGLWQLANQGTNFRESIHHWMPLPTFNRP